MKVSIKTIPILAAVAAAFALPAPFVRAADTIRVVATIPDLADMARHIGGDLVEVKSITKGSEDMHMVPMKPSHLLLLNKADMLFEMGLDMEHAWLPDLLYNCRNEKIQPGAPGFVNCSASIRPIEVPDGADRGDGEIHPEGNPHYNMDPRNGRRIAEAICAGFCRAYPKQEERFRANAKAYLVRFDRKLKEWEVLARPLRGTKVVTYHRSWSYFVRAYGLEVVGEIESKPGIAPTPGHLAKLVRRIKEEKARLVIKEQYYSNKYPDFLNEKTGIRVVTLPNMSGGRPEVEGYFNFIEHNIKVLLRSLDKPAATPEEIAKELEEEK